MGWFSKHLHARSARSTHGRMTTYHLAGMETITNYNHFSFPLISQTVSTTPLNTECSQGSPWDLMSAMRSFWFDRLGSSTGKPWRWFLPSNMGLSFASQDVRRKSPVVQHIHGNCPWFHKIRNLQMVFDYLFHLLGAKDIEREREKTSPMESDAWNHFHYLNSPQKNLKRVASFGECQCPE